jgi:nucleoid-associated protein EbfC
MSHFDFKTLLKQAKKLQSDLKKQTEDLETLKVEGQSGGGLIRILCNGRHDVLSVTLTPEALEQEKQVLEELIAAAFNDAIRRIEKQTKEKIFDFTKDMPFSAEDLNKPSADEDDNE